jgi:hypothetical protein
MFEQTGTAVGARRIDCRVEEWVERGRACEEYMAGEEDCD